MPDLVSLTIAVLTIAAIVLAVWWHATTDRRRKRRAHAAGLDATLDRIRRQERR